MPRNRLLLALALTASTVILVVAVGGWPSAMGAPSAPQSIVGSWSNEVIGLPCVFR